MFEVMLLLKMLVLLAALPAPQDPDTDRPLFGKPAESDATDTVSADLAADVDPATAKEALDVLDRLPGTISAEQAAGLRELDRRLTGESTAEQRRLGERIAMRLAHCSDRRSLAYLHQVFESTPERRAAIARAISTHVSERTRRVQDWRLLVRSLPILGEEDAARVITALRRYPQRATHPESQRQLILQGLRHRGDVAVAAVGLLQHWCNQPYEDLGEWEAWFRQQHPDHPPAQLPVLPEGSKYTFTQLQDFLAERQDVSEDTSAGAAVYERAQCIKCHRFGERGEAMGPDLTSAGRKFQTQEILRAVLYPSFGISEEYTSQTIVDRQNRRYRGIVSVVDDRLIVLTTTGQKVTLSRDKIADIRPSRQSAMSENLFNALTLEEIRDLIAYLKRGIHTK